MLYLRARNVKLETGLHSALANARLCSVSFLALQGETFSSLLPKFPPDASASFLLSILGSVFKNQKHPSWGPWEVETPSC